MGTRLQGWTKDKRKQGNFVSHVILRVRNIFSHIPPTVDVSWVFPTFVLSRVTAETQRSREKAKRATQTAEYRRGTAGTTLVSLKAVNRRQDVFELWSVFKQYKSLCLSNLGLFRHFSFDFFSSPACWRSVYNCVSVLTFQGPTGVKPSIALPRVRSNSIRMAISDMSQDGDD